MARRIRLTVLSEKRTEDIAKELLEVRGWNSSRPPRGNILWKNEYREFSQFRTAFANQSKTGMGPGYPDFLIIDPKTSMPLIVGETKASASDIVLAKNESIGYADALASMGYYPLAVGIAGNAENEIQVEVNKLSTGGQWKPVMFRESPIQWLPTPKEADDLITDRLLFDLYPQIPSEETLAKRAEEINRIFRECRIKDEFRPAVIGAFMLGLVTTRGNIRTNPDYVLLDINHACKAAFANAGKIELAESILVPEANRTLASRAAEVIYILRLLNLTTLTGAHDYLGQLYETFFRYTGGNTIGQFFTPRHIAKFMGDVCQISDSDVVVDPACGTGGFLIAALYRMIGKRGYTQDQISKLVSQHLLGFEIEPVTAALCVANMIIRGDGHTGVVLGSCFDDPKYPIGRATVVLGNPPFPHKKDDDQPEKFVDRGLEALSSRGQLAMVVPTSLLAKAEKGGWRKSVLKNNTLKAVIELPSDLFQPYASSTTGIIIIEHGLPHHPNAETFFCHISNDGFRMKKNRRIRRDGEQLTLAAASYLNHLSIPGLCSFNNLVNLSRGGEWTPGAYITAAEHSPDDISTEIDGLTSSLVGFHGLHARELSDYSSALSGGQTTPIDYQKSAKRTPISGQQPRSIASLFSIYYGQKALHNKEPLVPGTSLIISSKGKDNGCYGFYAYEDVIKAPFVTAPGTGSIGEANVQLWPCGVTDDCLLLFPKPGTTEEDLWLAAATIRLERWRFNYGRKMTPARVGDFVLSQDAPLIEQTKKAIETATGCAMQVVQSLSGQVTKVLPTDVTETFERLAMQWKSDTGLMSNESLIVLHPSYQQIIGLGEPAIPLMLNALAMGDYSEWFWALRSIARIDPVSELDAGDVEQMAKEWIRWGETKGYLTDLRLSTKQNSQT